jgi:cytochrome c553
MAAGGVKVAGLVVLGLALALGLAAAAIYLVSEMKLNDKLSAPGESIAVPTDVASVQHGQHLVGAIALCTACHGPTLGGELVANDRLARIVAPNLTRGGVGAKLSDADLARAIRRGVDPSGRQLWLMPADDYARLSDTDLGSIVAYLKSLPPTTSPLPTNQIQPLGRVLLATGQFQLMPAASIERGLPRPAAPDVGLTAAYGSYLAAVAGCARCHGPGLSKLASAALNDWSDADFLRAMRSGRRPNGSAIDTAMPWPYYAQMSDLELRAIWQFLAVVPALR